jgi:hypothetical protein
MLGEQLEPCPGIEGNSDFAWMGLHGAADEEIIAPRRLVSLVSRIG